MWIFTPIGFFSIVQKPGDDFLTVRSRWKVDLERFQAAMSVAGVATDAPIEANKGTDYQFRFTGSHDAIAITMDHMIRGINYNNFKGKVGKIDAARAHVYMSVWTALNAASRSGRMF